MDASNVGGMTKKATLKDLRWGSECTNARMAANLGKGW